MIPSIQYLLNKRTCGAAAQVGWRHLEESVVWLLSSRCEEFTSKELLLCCRGTYPTNLTSQKKVLRADRWEGAAALHIPVPPRSDFPNRMRTVILVVGLQKCAGNAAHLLFPAGEVEMEVGACSAWRTKLCSRLTIRQSHMKNILTSDFE